MLLASVLATLPVQIQNVLLSLLIYLKLTDFDRRKDFGSTSDPAPQSPYRYPTLIE